MQSNYNLTLFYTKALQRRSNFKRAFIVKTHVEIRKSNYHLTLFKRQAALI